MKKQVPAWRLDEVVAAQVKTAREHKRWKQSDLAARLVELGFTGWRQSKVAKLENGDTKRLSVEELVALAAALGVQPIHLLTPADDEALVEVAPKLTLSALATRQWLRGVAPLSDDDGTSYFAGVLTPERDADDWLKRRYEIEWFPRRPEMVEGQTFVLGRDAQWHEYKGGST
jgi:transcriptional regulator with XRE-family HTH domain